MNRFKINQGRLIMWQFRVAGTLLVFFIGAAAFLKLEEFQAIAVFIAASFLLPALWSSYSVFELHADTGVIREYYWVAGIRFNEEVTHFTVVEKIFINQVRMGQNVHSYYTGSVRTTKSIEYKAFLKLDENQKFFLLSDANPDRLRERILPMAKRLNCDLAVNY